MAEDGLPLRKPTLEDFVFEGEETPLLLRWRVVGTIVAAFVLLVLAYIASAEFFDWSYQIDAEPFREWVGQFGFWSPIVYMVVMAFSVLFAPIPNVPIFIAAGVLWGPVLGTVYSQIGLNVGSALAFWISRRLGRRHLGRLVGGKAADRIDRISERAGGQVILLARLMPVVNFDVLSYAAGLTAISFRAFIIASFIGSLIPTAMAVVAGDALERDIRITLGMGGLWVLMLVVSVAFFYYRHRRGHGFFRGWRDEPPDPGEDEEARST